ncbi:hypothetical protein QF032_007862 [Streptomyces achromogenes]|nr:hypothetical protein [Streptomyces achromogenes]
MAGRGGGAPSCCARWSPQAGRGCRYPPPVGVRRPAGRHADPSAARPAARSAGAAVRCRPLHHHPRDRRSTRAPGRAGSAVPDPDRPGLRLRTLADVFAHAQAEGIELRPDATEVQGHRPPAGRGGRQAFVSGKKKQNTMKATVTADHQGRTLCPDAMRPGRMHEATAARNEGIAVFFRHFPDVEVLLDDGYLPQARPPRPGGHATKKSEPNQPTRGPRSPLTSPPPALIPTHQRRTRPRPTTNAGSS